MIQINKQMTVSRQNPKRCICSLSISTECQITNTGKAVIRKWGEQGRFRPMQRGNNTSVKLHQRLV